MSSRVPPLRFRPRWWAFALAAAGCAAGVLLGNWQSGRAEEKRALAAARRMEEVRGTFLPRFTLLLDNRAHQGRAGFHVLQPLQLREGGNLLVLRGWIPAGPTRERLPEVRTPAGEVVLRGARLERLPRAYEPGDPVRQGSVWQNATVAEVAAWSGLALAPWVLEQHSALEDGLVRDWPRPDADVPMHESYALQWYSLAALSVALFVVLSFRRERADA